MKQIFDWLREQIKDGSFSYTQFDGLMPEEFDVVSLGRALDTVNEAEAKWEADCCKWVHPSKEHGFIRNPHTGRIFSNEPSMQNVYCNTCGKPIKISEVE